MNRGERTRGLRHCGGGIGIAIFALVAGSALTLWSAGCGSDDYADYAIDGLLNGQGRGSGCETPNDFCACNEPGKVVECGRIEHRSADLVTCSMGKRRCEAGRWSACEGDHFITTRSFSGGGPLGGIRTASLGASTGCTGGGGSGGPGMCVGGAQNGQLCIVSADCPSGSCTTVAGICVGGAKNGSFCVGTPDCRGGSCNAPFGVCVGGGQDRQVCAVPADCSGGTCTPGWGACSGGANSGGVCLIPAHCPAGTCSTSGASNPCDPYCNQVIDTPGGLTLPTAGGPPACKSPVDWTAYYAQYAGNSRPNGALPTTCTTPPDNCSLDNKCSAGVCARFGPSAFGSCVGVDFTLSTPCYDGTNFTFQVCNRGTVPANTGLLPIAHDNGAPSVPASTGTRAVNGAAGQCNLNLAVTPLAPGQCRQVTPATDCGIDTSVGDHSFYVNFQNTPTVLATASLAECDTSNNFTATKDTAAGVAGAACTAVTCGTTSPGGGQYPPNFSSPDGLNTGCAGASNNVVAGACNDAPGPNSNCAQDFHCDTGSNTCTWNVTGDWVDTTCAGVDLTIGAGCQDTATSYHVPVCNRGMGTLPSGSTIAVNIDTGAWAPASACTTNVGAYHCGLTISAPLRSGQCVDIPGCTGQTGERNLIVNPAGTIAECTQCNNWAHTKTTGAGCTVACTVPPPANVQIYGHSATTLYRVDPITYAVTTVGAFSGCGTPFDLAIDASGNMYANSSTSLYKVAYPTTGSGSVTCTFLSTNPTSFNGLTFTPTSLLSPSPAAEPLHGAANNGGWYKITLSAGGAPVTYNLIGYYGGAAGVIQSSGDAVGIIGDGEYVMVLSGTTTLPGGDHLWKINPNTGAKITDITPSGSGLSACYGIAYWGGTTYIFCGGPSSGIYTINTTTGATALVKATPAISWYGAAVTTTSPTLPPTPPAPPPSSQYFTRDYTAVCPVGTHIAWSFFSWQATIPASGSIQFYAQTAPTPAAFGPVNSAPSATPPAVLDGTASVTTTPPGTWFQDANTVDWHLKNDPPGGQLSRESLRITMKFNTGSGTVPTLSTWKQTYDCVPAE